MKNPELATALILVSALMHASWNAWLKTVPDKLPINCFFSIMCGVVSLPFVFFVPLPDATLWGLIAATTIIHTVYQLTLIRVLELTDLTVGYPIARGAGPLVVAVASFAVWPGEMTATSFIAVLVIVAGIMGGALAVVAAKGREALRGVWFALACGLMIGTYTVIDGYSAQYSPNFWTFVIWSNVAFAPAFPLIAMKLRGRTILSSAFRSWRQGLPITIIGLTGYTTALYAMRIGSVGEIAALRETSIVFAGIIGWLVLKENMPVARVASILLICGGAIALKAV